MFLFGVPVGTRLGSSYEHTAQRILMEPAGPHEQLLLQVCGCWVLPPLLAAWSVSLFHCCMVWPGVINNQVQGQKQDA